jgi:gliding motility-associated-like protein
MKKMQKMIKLFVFALLIACQASFAQTNKAAQNTPPMHTYIFTNDSLLGFDESAARSSAISEGFLGEEFKVRMWQLKRHYVNTKYGITPKIHKYKNSTYNNSKSAVVAACVNEDFEGSPAGIINTSNQINGWTVSSGINQFPSNSCNLSGCCLNPPTECELITAPATGYIDPVISANYPIYSVFGTGTNAGPSANPTIQNMYGTNFIRINSNLNNYTIAKLSKTFLVSSSNALFQFAFISVFSTGHTCCDAGAFQINLTNATANTVIPCPNFTVSAPSTQCAQSGTNLPAYFNAPAGTPATSASSLVYNKWKVSSIDLTAYIGQSITIDIVATDCTASGHYGYVYFDAQCGPMTIIGNGNPFAAGTPSITLPTCGSSGATIVAPGGLGPYQWAGPGVGPPFTTPAYTNQTYTTNISGNYTLTMNPPGSCQPIIRVITVSITPAPQVFASVQQAPCGGTLAIASCTTAGSASVASTIAWSPTPLSLNSTSTQATYSIATGPVSVTVSDPLGCTTTATMNINGAPPIPTLTVTNVTGSGSITCQYQSINFTATSSYTNGSLTYTWVSLSSTASGTNVSFTNPQTITVTATDPATGCGSFSVLTIGINTVAPSSTVSPVAQNITCVVGSVATFTAITTSTMTNVTHQWFSPFSPGAATAGGTISIQTLNAPGTYTHCLVNNINGCSTCKTLTVVSSASFPTVSVVSPSQFTIGCSTTSLTSINITSVVTNPIGAGVTFTVLPPSYTGPSYTLTGNPTFTANAPGQYTVIAHQISNGCETQIPVSIIQNTFQPQITAFAVTPTLTCYTPKTILQGTSTNTNVSYSWAFPGPPAGLQPNDTLTAFSTTLTTNTVVATYTLSITDNINKCKSTQTLTIYQNTFKPTPIITGTNVITCATPTVNLINGSTSNIPATFFPTQPVVGLLWAGPSPQPTLANTSNYIAYTPASTGNSYTMTALDLNNGCTAVATKTIADNRIYPNVNNPVGPNPFILDCGPLGSTTATIQPIVTGTTTGFTYSWTAVPTTSFSTYTLQTTTVNKIGEYVITVTNPSNGCSTSGEVHVINGTLNGDFSPSAVSGYAPLSVNFTNLSASSSTSTPTASITTAWSFGNGSSLVTPSVSISPLATYVNPGTYTVTMIVVKGSCMDTVQKVITVDIPSKLEVPNVFTPNGDGSNDTFFLKVQNVTDIHVYIFDRWGNQVYETTSSTGNITWDGKSGAGKDLPVGTYFYTLKATGKDGTEYDKKGNVSIYR